MSFILLPPKVNLTYPSTGKLVQPSIEAGSAPASLPYKEEKNADLLWAGSFQRKPRRDLAI